MEKPRRSEISEQAEQRQKYSACPGSFRLLRLLLLVQKEIRHSYCVLTTAHVVAWPVLELAEGQLENFSPCLKNTTTEVCVVHLYGPDFEQTVPD